jgi:hypothetical protein
MKRTNFLRAYAVATAILPWASCLAEPRIMKA